MRSKRAACQTCARTLAHAFGILPDRRKAGGATPEFHDTPPEPEALSVVPTVSELPTLRERDVESAICEALSALSLSWDRQVECDFAGIADIVTDACVIEVKLAIRNRREFHQAAGQAKAYADELSKPYALVCAPSVPSGLAGAQVFGVRLVEAGGAAIVVAGLQAEAA
jgi:hypothetical protein